MLFFFFCRCCQKQNLMCFFHFFRWGSFLLSVSLSLFRRELHWLLIILQGHRRHEASPDLLERDGAELSLAAIEGANEDKCRCCCRRIIIDFDDDYTC